VSTNINIIKRKKLKNPVLLVGLPGIGLVGKIAVDYIVKELGSKCKEYAKITSDSFPPAVHTKKGFIELIYDSIYVYRYKNKDYLFLIGPVQPSLVNASNSKSHYEFADKIADFCKKANVKEIYTFAGINVGEKRLKKSPKVISVFTDKKIKKKISKIKISNLNSKKVEIDTLISGVAGLLIGRSYYKYKISGCCFLGETDQKLVFGDQGSAKNILQIISKLVDFKVDLKKINKEAKKIEQSFNKITNKIKDIDKKEKPTAKYIR